MATTVTENSSAVIDERRAQQLMERAMTLAERGDLTSAVLACRQAITLTPQSPQSYSMLGLLLERAGDASGAVAAYEKVLELAPDSFLERESLSRLRGAASQRRNARELFAFDDNELFGAEDSEALPTATAQVGSTPDAAPAAETETESPAPVAPNVSPASAAASGDAATSGTAPIAASVAATAGSTPGASAVDAAAKATASAKPEAMETNGAAAKSAATKGAATNDTAPRPHAPPFATTRPTPGGVGVPLDLPVPAPRAAKQSAWQRLKQRPTPYFRGAPLAGATAVSLLFLLWANNYASSNRAADTPVVAPVVTENPFDNPVPEAPKPGASPANPALTNQPVASSPVPTNPGTLASANPGNSGTPATSGVPTNPGAPAPTSVPTNPAPAASANTAPQNAGSTPGAPSVSAPTNNTPPAPSPAPGSAPADSGGASASGNPLGPTGAPSKDYVRVAPAGGTPVARPENRAANDERNARNDAQAGRPNAAIESLSRAIESGGPDVAVRYQQRAQLYLQNGDGARASSDFQAAISAYNDMIARGDRVAIARSGIAACRRGLQMAQARR
jgi:tetratricopeptide (TPR) repeat protein